MRSPVTLHGRLCRLELMRPDHIDGLLLAATADRSTYDYTYVPRDHDAVVRYVALATSDYAAGVAVPFTTVAIDPVTGEERIVGTSRLRELEYWRAGVWPPRHGHINPDGRPDAAEIGSTWLHPVAQRTGINTEAKLMMLTYAFEAWDVHRVSLKTDVRNTRSRAAISALGAQFEGIRRAHFPAADGGVRDSALFSIVRAEWPAAKTNLEARLQRYLDRAATAALETDLDTRRESNLEATLEPVNVDPHLVQPVQARQLDTAVNSASGPSTQASPVVQAPALPAA
ncbi:MAG: GNAT family N-acetyltransferase [Catenulisporales bacterium]|nr:GNAT family N-acetyltransferase [Catenulisporales bacterium]